MRKRGPEGPSRSDRKIAAIAGTAARLFSSKGYIETSLDDIAAAARISKGLIYYYFSTKDEILDYILTTFLDTVLENAGQDLQEVADPAERIRIMIERHVKTYTTNMYLAKTLMQEAHNLPAAKLKKIKTREREYFAIVSGVLSSYLGGDAGKDRLTVLTFSLLGMCNWLFAWYDPKKAIGPEQLAQMIFDTFINGLSGLIQHGSRAAADQQRRRR
jgi:AcrR family transcriptional regulator